MARGSRWVLVLSCFAALGFTLYAYSVSPEVVPVHYGAKGIPDRWGPRGEVLRVFGGVIGIGTVLLLALPALFLRAPKSMINLPNEEYWLAPERRGAATAKFAVWAHTLGTAINVLMVTLQLALASGHGRSPGTPNALPDLIVLTFVLFSLGSCVWLVWSYRMPAPELRAHDRQ